MQNGSEGERLGSEEGRRKDKGVERVDKASTRLATVAHVALPDGRGWGHTQWLHDWADVPAGAMEVTEVSLVVLAWTEEKGRWVAMVGMRYTLQTSSPVR